MNQQTWEIFDKKAFDSYSLFFTRCGYPWFLRQFLVRAMSVIYVRHIDAGQGPNQLVVGMCGRFHGVDIENLIKKMPPMVFTLPHHMPVALAGRQWFAVSATTEGVPTIHPKLCHRFVNMHRSVVSAEDGSCFTDLLNYNPRQFFGAGLSIRQMFDFEEMQRWLEHLKDVDESGLPREMVRGHWDRAEMRSRLIQRGGVACLDWEIHIYEFDAATNYWTRLRCSHCASFRKTGSK